MPVFGGSGFSVTEVGLGGHRVRLHVGSDLPELAALFAQSLAPPVPKDRTAFFVGLAQGAYAGVVQRLGRRRPPSILARQEVLEAEERASRLERERAMVRAGSAGGAGGGVAGARRNEPQPGQDRGPGEAGQSPPAPDPWAQARAAQEQRRREADFRASMEAGRVASARVRSSGIILRLRDMPPALPAHGAL